MQTAFTVSIEAKKGITTGISAQDRAKTIKTAINPNVKKKELVPPEQRIIELYFIKKIYLCLREMGLILKGLSRLGI